MIGTVIVSVLVGLVLLAAVAFALLVWMARWVRDIDVWKGRE